MVTQPSRPSGRGGHMTATPVAAAIGGVVRGVPTWRGTCTIGRRGRTACGLARPLYNAECENINDEAAVERLREAGADVMVVADFGQFIKGPARSAVRVDAINLHGSLLPELRGAAPINWAIIRGYKRTGVTTFSLVGKMDAGDVYLQEAVEIDPAWTAQELRERLAEVGASVVCGRWICLRTGRRCGLGRITPRRRWRRL